MKTHELLSAVRDSAGIDTPEHAERAVQATLLVLGERLAGGETGDLASQLPPELAEALPDHGPGETFGLPEFYRRVGENEGTEDTREARRHARAVLAAVRASVTPGQYEHLVGQLPADYDDLLSTQPVQH